MKTFKGLNNIVGWLVFIVAAIVYLLTIEPTASWWDCGEYIATTFKLQVGHPPGAPLFQLVGRIFSLFAFGDLSRVAMMVNSMSALCSAFTILFLFWSITMLGLKLVDESKMTVGQQWAIIGSGLVGALAYTFSDSFWFSAVEGEVYAMSSFFTAIVFWAMLKWDRVYDQPYSSKWIVFIAFLVGLSIGVHLLNLLTIPAMVLVFYYRKYKANWKGTLIALATSILLVALVLFIIVPYSVELAGRFEIFFINELGFPFNTGTLLYFLVLIGAIVWGIFFTQREKHSKLEYALGLVLLLALCIFSWKTLLIYAALIAAYMVYKRSNLSRERRELFRTTANTAVLSLAFILIGFSTFLTLVIRANVDPPINENDPSNAVSLLSYLNREQYGEPQPVFYGKYWNAEPVGTKDHKPVYERDDETGKYVSRQESYTSEYDPRFCTVFPRMWNADDPDHIRGYKEWGKIKGTPIDVQRRDGSTETKIKPTFQENLRYFFAYQLNHMYWRYFMWNFSGRQNDIQGHGGIKYGNWITGIPFIDNARLGDQSNLPPQLANNPAKNKFYMLPLLLGIVGLVFHFNRHAKGGFIVLMLFFMTGIAIVLYLNQPPYEPRERDYAFAGSFYAFAIWIGLGVMAICDWLRKYNEKITAVAVTLACMLLVPYIMGKEGWSDHNRAHKYTAFHSAANALNSCGKDGLLVTYGDNDTFSLWYAQDVEDVRTDVRVCNSMLASSDWYAHQMLRKVYDSDKMPSILGAGAYDKGNNVWAVVPMFKERVELKEVLELMASKNPKLMKETNGYEVNIFPANKLKITIDTAEIRRKGLVPKELEGRLTPVIEFDLKGQYIYRNDLLVLDIIAANNFERPVHFFSLSDVKKNMDFSSHCYQTGWIYTLFPVSPDSNAMGGFLSRENIDAKVSYDIIMDGNKTRWGNLNDPRVTVDRYSYMMATMLYSPMVLGVAERLSLEGDSIKAAQLVDKLLEAYPYPKFELSELYAVYADIYYRANQIEKANKLVSDLISFEEKNLQYILSLKRQFQPNFVDDYQSAIHACNFTRRIVDRYQQKELADRLDKLMMQYSLTE